MSYSFLSKSYDLDWLDHSVSLLEDHSVLTLKLKQFDLIHDLDQL